MANIVICADGTWNRPEEDLEKDHATNVLKIARAIKPKLGDLKQHVFYDWGLGSYHSSVSAGVTGSGIHKNILDGYRYIVQNYSLGDQIYLFGFSRGAYTVRALCGLINNCGIVKRADAKLIQKAWNIYKRSQKKYSPSGTESIAFRKAHCHASRSVHFVGVWDTVGSLGIPFSLLGLLDSKDEFYDTKMGSNVNIARHALAIDEQRQDFEPTLWVPRQGVDLKQVWFSGVHTDVGGSYAPDKKTGTVASDVPLDWMIIEAKSAGLKFEPHLVKNLSDGTLAPLHKSHRHVFRFKKALHRPLVNENYPSTVHSSVKVRYEADAKYRPKRLKELVDSVGWQSVRLE